MGKIRSGTHSNTNQLEELSKDGWATPQGNIQTVYMASLEMESPRKTEKGTLSKHLAMKCLLPLKFKVFIMILANYNQFQNNQNCWGSGLL